MILALTNSLFAPYGTVSGTVGLDPSLFNGMGSEIVQKFIYPITGHFMVSYERPIVLANSSGYAILFLSHDSEFSRIEAFPIERPLKINPGVYFYFQSLYGDCNVLCHYEQGSELEIVEAPDITLEPTLPLKVAINKVYTIIYQEWEKNRRFPGEQHDFWELAYVDKGYLHSVAGGAEMLLEQGEIVFYGPGQHHVQFSQKTNPVCFITVSFDLEMEGSDFLLDRKFKLNSSLAEILEKILLEKEQNLCYSPDLVSCYMKEFIVLLMRGEKLGHAKRTLETAHKRRTEHELLDSAVDFINQNLRSHLTVSSVAAHLHISSSYMSVLFRKYQQTSLLEYINLARLEYCKDLIRGGKYSFTEIADMMGYSSIHYFSRQFKNYYGISPSDYSKQIRYG